MLRSTRDFRRAAAVLVISIALQFLCCFRWPGNPQRDVAFSLLAAENFVEHGRFESVNPLADFHGDLAQHARFRRLIQWPPGQSWLYAAAMSAGLSPGAATKAAGLLAFVAGGLGWLCLARFLGASSRCLSVISAFYPWLPYVSRAFLAYDNDHLSLAMSPWICLALLRIEPLASAGSGAGTGVGARNDWWMRLPIAALLMMAASALVKYSMVVFPFAAALYLLWLDGGALTRRRVPRLAAAAAFVIFVGMLYVTVNHAYGERIRLVPAANPSSVSSARNFLYRTIASPMGWDDALMGSQTAPGGLFLQSPRGSLLLVSLAVLAIWIAHFRRWPWREHERSFGVLMSLLTASLWAMLLATTYLSHGQWDATNDHRLYRSVITLWLLAGAVSLDRMDAKRLARSAAFYSLAVPVVFNAVSTARYALQEAPYPRRPNSATAWVLSADPRHAAFLANYALARGHSPDLIIAESNDAAELRVPCLPASIMEFDRGYWSSRNIEVWAMIEPAKAAALRSSFRRASSMENVPVPAGAPFVFCVFRFSAEPPSPGR